MPTLYLSCGPPGCGKTTNGIEFAAEKGAVRLSSDELRAYYGKDESDQSVSGFAFRHIEITIEILMRQGFDVLVDSTNVTLKSRAPLIAIARKYGADVVALVYNTSLETCIARNASRARVVPEYVIIRMFGMFERPKIGEVDRIIPVDAR